MLFLKGVAKTSCLVGTHLNLCSEKLELTHGLKTCEKCLSLCICDLGVSRVKLTTELLNFILESLCLLCNTVNVGGLKLLCGIVNKGISLTKESKHAKACCTLDTSYTCGNRGFGNNLKETDITGVRNVSTTAKLGGGGADLNDSYLRAILFSEESHCAHLLCLVGSGNDGFCLFSKENITVNNSFNLSYFLCGHSCKVSEVETNSMLVNVRACLLNVSAENLTKSRLKKMRRRVISLYSITASNVNSESNGVTGLYRAVLNLALMKIYSVSLLCIKNGESSITKSNSTGVANLSTALAVEHGLVGYDGAFTLRNRVHSLVVHEYGEDLALALGFGVAEELGLGEIFKKRLRRIRPAGDITSCRSCSLLLLVHKSLESILVDREACLFGNLAGKVYGEAEGIVKLEGISAGKSAFTLLLCIGNKAVKDTETCVDSCVKSLFLKGHNLKDIVVFCLKLRICTLVLRNNDLA